MPETRDMGRRDSRGVSITLANPDSSSVGVVFNRPPPSPYGIYDG